MLLAIRLFDYQVIKL